MKPLRRPMPPIKRDISAIHELVIHCTASGPKTTLEDIKKWHIARGFSDIGYHYVIMADGSVRNGRPWETIGAHCEGHNLDTLGISLVGGHDGKVLHKFTDKQIGSLKTLITSLKGQFSGIKSIKGHYQYDRGKSCPCIDIPLFISTGVIKYTV